MWNVDITRQSVVVGHRRFTAEDREELCSLSREEPDEALRYVYAFLTEWFSETSEIEVQTSGSTGVPKRMRVSKRRMMCSACRTCGFLGLKEGDTALLCMDMKYIGAKMMVVRALVAGMCLVVRKPSSAPLADVEEHIDFLSIVPMQLYCCVQDRKQRERLEQVRCVIVGGGAVDEPLCRRLEALPCKVYSTYGMTETLSHIALRRLNGEAASDFYVPMDGICLSLSACGTLVIDAPDICEGWIVTNDVVRLLEDGRFTVVGRMDNVVNSGGVKIQVEEDELVLRQLIPVPFVLTSVPDECLGEAMVLLVRDDLPLHEDYLRESMKVLLSRYHVPRHIIRIPQIPEAGNGKIDRKACRKVAADMLSVR